MRRPFRPVVGSSTTNGMRSFISLDAHRRERVRRHPGHVEVGNRPKYACIAWLRSLLPELCALAGRSGKGQISTGQREAAMTRMLDGWRSSPEASRGIGQAIAELLAREVASRLRGAHPEGSGRSHLSRGRWPSTVA